jgi:hypothetical protein
MLAVPIRSRLLTGGIAGTRCAAMQRRATATWDTITQPQVTTG